MSNEFVMVPRKLAEEINAALTLSGYVSLPRGLQVAMAKPAEQNQGEPVAWVRFRNGEPDYDGDAVMISNVPGDTLGDGDSWECVFTKPDIAELDRLHDSVKALTTLSLARLDLICEMRAQLAEAHSLLHRALPYLSNTPDLVQHGAEDLAEEIRSASAGRPCYGPNEWGTECGKCSKCKHASAEKIEPVAPDQPNQ